LDKGLELGDEDFFSVGKQVLVGIIVGRDDGFINGRLVSSDDGNIDGLDIGCKVDKGVGKDTGSINGVDEGYTIEFKEEGKVVEG